MTRRTVDVSHLPRPAFGHRSLPWWGTFSFIVIEATALAVVVAAYFYLRRNFLSWPPQPIEQPALLLPTLNLVLILLSIWPLRAAAAAADRVDAAGVGRALAAAVALGLLILALRAFEFPALNVRWDDNAYGSVVWLLLGLHTALLIADVLETAAIGAIFWLGRIEAKHYPDVEDAALYQYFLAGAWVVLYAVIYLAPRFM